MLRVEHAPSSNPKQSMTTNERRLAMSVLNCDGCRLRKKSRRSLILRKKEQAGGGTWKMFREPGRPERLSASVRKLRSIVGRSPGLKFLPVLTTSRTSSQWRDRTGFSPVSLFSPVRGAPRCFQIKRTILDWPDTITRSSAVSNLLLSIAHFCSTVRTRPKLAVCVTIILHLGFTLISIQGNAATNDQND